MIYLPQPVPQVLIASGVLLLVIAVVYLSRANGGLEDPLTRAGISRGQRAKILNLLYKKGLPIERPERKLAIERAEYEVAAGPALLTWIPMLCGSVVLMLFGAYLLEPIALTSFVLQCVAIALGIFITLKARRSIRSCRNVITSLHVASSGPRLLAMIPIPKREQLGSGAEMSNSIGSYDRRGGQMSAKSMS